MKFLVSIAIAAGLLTVAKVSAQTRTLPHMDLNMSGFEYEALLAKEQPLLGVQPKKHIFDDIFATGKRNLDWIRLLNQNRQDRISLSTPETQQGFPIHSPRIYNVALIRASYDELKQSMPEPLRNVIFGSSPLPTQLPCALEDYIKWGLQVDRVYQIAARWRTYEPYRDHLLMNSVKDVRGYHFLTTMDGLLEKLSDWKNLTNEEKPQITLWLNQVCRNSLRDIDRCRSLTEQAIQNNQAVVFFNKHKTASEEIIREMMYIPDDGHFGVVNWKTEHEVHVPFKEPTDLAMRSYLLDNIEKEWNLSPFALKVNWVAEDQYGVDVIWSPGVTPHVPGLGSHQIYMDANAPITEYDVQWTIRHEFGHVLGFPDCYIEFYDTDLKAIVGYQIDTSDLMCSRQGHLKDRHVQEMKRVYR